MDILRIKEIIEWFSSIFVIRRYEVLRRLIEENDFETFAEVGVWDGITSRYLLKTCPKLKKVICVDNYASNNDYTTLERVHQAYYNAEDLQSHEKVKFYNTNSKKASKQIKNNSLDIVFIDANHTYDSVKEDINLWLPKVKEGGILCGHDFRIKHFGTILAVYERFFPIEIEHDNFWWIRKGGNIHNN